MPEIRDKNGRFLPGNPGGGRMKIPEEAKAILKAATPDAARALVELLQSKRENIRFIAAQEILNRTQGKPEQMSKIELAGVNDKTIIFKWIDVRKENTNAGNNSTVSATTDAVGDS